MTNLITSHQAIQGLRDAVAERGRDYRDPLASSGDCRYVVGDKPGCIGGTALNKIGVPLAELRKWEGCNVESMVAGVKTYSPDRGEDDGLLTREAARVLTRAQEIQDDGDEWGDALDSAERVYRAILAEGESQ